MRDRDAISFRNAEVSSCNRSSGEIADDRKVISETTPPKYSLNSSLEWSRVESVSWWSVTASWNGLGGKRWREAGST